MPGYLINLGALEGRLDLYIQSGIYGTRIGRTGWYPATLYTLADYLSMRTGELIFFFQKRMIYGLGSTVSIDIDAPTRPMACNYARSYLPTENPSPPFLWDGDDDPSIRWRVLFRPSPAFFKIGVDMDEVLQADSAGVARSLRVFSNRSFLKLEDDESHLIATAILRRNQQPGASTFADHTNVVHSNLSQHPSLSGFQPDIDELVAQDLHGSQIRHEPTLQAWLVDALNQQRPETTAIFGDWNYVSNLYPASPLKPREYMDEIDIFGYVLSYPQAPIPPYVVRFKIIEVKIGPQSIAPSNVIDQVMKYVDWVSNTRAGGDYSLVDAYVVAADFTDELVQYAAANGTRSYVIPRRPYETNIWTNLSLVTYQASVDHPAVHLQGLH